MSCTKLSTTIARRTCSLLASCFDRCRKPLALNWLAMDRPTVTVKQGKLQGQVVNSLLDGTYLSFRGIPFAAPPVGKLRFKDPQPPASWQGVRDASKVVGEISAQIDEFPPCEMLGGEDCLYLSVYTGSLTGSRPVMVWVHGGAFVVGTERDYRPDYLIRKDVVVVCISYRLGALGFLNLGHEVAAGNQGMKDQVAALRWVKENIANFGGDPNNVTVFGASAGGASVHYLAISPMSKGLFNKGIPISGTANCIWASVPSIVERSFKLAELLGKETNDPNEALELLQNVPFEKIVKTQFQVLEHDDILQLPFGPSIDSASSNPFLPRPLNELSANDNDIPMIVGYTSDEFIMFLKDTSAEFYQRTTNRIPHYVRKATKATDDKVDKLAAELTYRYFQGKPLGPENLPAIVRFLSDVYFVSGCMKLVDDRRKRSSAPTYCYRFSYVGDEMTLTKAMLKDPPIKGASHVDDMPYFFYLPRLKNGTPPPAPGTKDFITLERMTRVFTNFAKTGNPTPSLDEYVTTKWCPATKDSYVYLDIGDDLKPGVITKDDVLYVYHKYD